MKLVLDFDEVLFNTKSMREHFTRVLEKRGVDPRMTELLYMKHRETGIPFSLKRFLWAVAIRTEKREILAPEVYEEIMSACTSLANKDLLRAISSFKKNDIIILTNGDKEYQLDKIERSLGKDFASEVIVVTGSKKDELAKICGEHKHDQVLFVEDQQKFIDDLDRESMKNLEVILFGLSGIGDVQEAIKKHTTKKKAH